MGEFDHTLAHHRRNFQCDGGIGARDALTAYLRRTAFVIDDVLGSVGTGGGQLLDNEGEIILAQIEEKICSRVHLDA